MAGTIFQLVSKYLHFQQLKLMLELQMRMMLFVFDFGKCLRKQIKKMNNYSLCNSGLCQCSDTSVE